MPWSTYIKPAISILHYDSSNSNFQSSKVMLTVFSRIRHPPCASLKQTKTKNIVPAVILGRNRLTASSMIFSSANSLALNQCVHHFNPFPS
jgi:hypothetical protein